MTRRSLDDIEAEIAQSRAALGHSLDAIGQRLAPRQLITQGVSMVGRSLGGKASGLGQTIARNPLPLAVIGAGIGWLVYSARRQQPKPAEPAPETDQDPIVRTAARIEELATTIAEEFRSADADPADAAVSKLRRSNGHTAAGGSHDGQTPGDHGRAPLTAIRRIGEDLYERAADYVDEAGDTARDLGDTVSEAIDRYPLAIGGLAAIVGACLAFGLPPTEPEDRVLGSTRDALRDRALDSGRDVLARAEDTAGRAAAAALEAARDEIEAGAEADETAPIRD